MGAANAKNGATTLNAAVAIATKDAIKGKDAAAFAMSAAELAQAAAVATTLAAVRPTTTPINTASIGSKLSSMKSLIRYNAGSNTPVITLPAPSSNGVNIDPTTSPNFFNIGNTPSCIQ